MNLLDQFEQAPSGLFVLNVFRRGELVDVFEEKNLIVTNSKQIHARLLGGDVTNRSVTKIGFGSNGAPPAAGNTTLSSAFLKALDSVAYPSSNQVQFNFSLLSGENNGASIMEFGLLTGVNVLYARKVRSTALNKDADISLSGTWTITF